MPGKYSHSLVIADYSTRGLISLPEDQREHYLNTSAQYNGPRSMFDARLRGTQSAQGHRYRSSSLKSDVPTGARSIGSAALHPVRSDGQHRPRIVDSVDRQDKRASQLYTLGGRSEPQLPITKGDPRYVADVPVPPIPPDIRRPFHQPAESAYERQNKRNAGTGAVDLETALQGFGTFPSNHGITNRAPVSNNAYSNTAAFTLSQAHKQVDSLLNEVPTPATGIPHSLTTKSSYSKVKQGNNDSSRTAANFILPHAVQGSREPLTSQSETCSRVSSVIDRPEQVREQNSLQLERPRGLKDYELGGRKPSMEEKQRATQHARLPRSRPEPVRVEDLKPGNRSRSQGALDITESSKTPRSNSSLSSPMSNTAESPTAATRKAFSPKKAAYSPTEPAWRLPEIQEDHDFAHSMFEDDQMTSTYDKPMLSSIPETNVIGQISSGRDVSFENDDAASEMSAALPPPISRFRDEEAEFQANMAKFFGGDDATVGARTPSQIFKNSTKKSKGLFSRFRTKS